MEQEEIPQGQTDNLPPNVSKWQELTEMAQTLDTAERAKQLTNPETSLSPIDYIEKSGLNNVEQIESLIQNGTYQDFKVHLVRLNALFRNLSPEEHDIDGETVHVSDNLVPISSEYKEQVVESAFNALKDMPPKDRGILMYNILGAVHLFGDGNGRSMRVWHHLLSGEQLDNEELVKLTEHDNDTQNGTATTGRKEIQSHLNANTFAMSGIVNYMAFKSELDELGAQDIRSTFPWIMPEFNEGTIKALPIKDISRVKDICANDTGVRYCPFNILTMHLLAKEDPTFQTPSAELEGKVYMYDNEQAAGVTFTAEQARRFITINNEVKLKHFQTMIDIFRKPDEYMVSGKQLKEYFYAQ